MIRPESLKGCAGSLSVALLLMLAVVGRAGASPADEVLQGRMLYESRCGGCHAVDANRVGPMHRNLIGRRAGSVPDFAYSPALRSSSVVWSAQTLDQWLSKPESLIPGQRMNYSVSSEQDRRLLIRYLSSEQVSSPAH